MDQLIADTLADAQWFPLRYDAREDAFHFAWVPAEVHASVTFLSTLRPSADQRRMIRATAVATGVFDEAPLHFILHSGLGGSTLLAQALAQAGVVTTLKEPPIVADVIAFGRTATPAQAAILCQTVTRLLARPMAPGASVVIKMSSVGNSLVAAMAAQRETSRILCLRAPLETTLASLARAGLEGRLNARKSLIGLRNAGLGEFGYTTEELLAQTDLQLAALGWLAIQRLIQGAAAQFGGDRLRSIASDRLLGNPGAALGAIADHFGLALDVEERLASGIFERHAKSGAPFNERERKLRLDEAMEIHGAEIRLIVEWTRKVAEANRIAWDLPYPLPN